MPRFVISPHFRLQEWVAEDKGYFAGEGLDYEFREAIGTKDAKRQNLGDRVGAYQTIERGRREALRFLASPAGGYITGKIIEVDGGIDRPNLDLGIPDL